MKWQEGKKEQYCVVTIKEHIASPLIYGLWLITPLASLNLCFRCPQDTNTQSESDKLLTNMNSFECVLGSILSNGMLCMDIFRGKSWKIPKR